MAEASGDFVDVLFSFLSLPLGTITRLQSEGKFPHSQPFEIGCINNLYRSVKGLNPDVFWNKICKDMLISPRNPLEASCQKLKVKVDDTLPTKYFMCHSCSRNKDLLVVLVSTFDGARCHCGKLMKKETELLVEEPKEEENGVFVKGDAMFLIFDDLRVIRSSPGNSVQPLLKHRYKDLSKMDRVVVDLGVNEIFNILKQALTSKSPLSDAFIENKESKPSYTFSPYTGPSHLKDNFEIKVIVSKSQNKVLFAEANADFIDFLVSFLTTPLGSILNLMNAKLSLGSIDNLYTSVKKLNPSWFTESSNKSLLNPRVAPQFGCKSNNLNASQDTPKYWYGTGAVKDNMGRIMISKRKDMVQDPKEVKLFEPRCCDGARELAVGFMKRPCLFVVRDDLQVIPITTTSSILYLQQLENIQLNDLEEHLVEIRKSHEVIKIHNSLLTACSFAAIILVQENLIHINGFS
uniref:DUF674 family protein n=1 Tax=Cajanus cajan TaxID=3821 RepID=A0A151UCU6_CAJCA|nr:hypothetical protein KK1_021388 [Cajanus cajan]